jgi:hypothetical protein
MRISFRDAPKEQQGRLIGKIERLLGGKLNASVHTPYATDSDTTDKRSSSDTTDKRSSSDTTDKRSSSGSGAASGDGSNAKPGKGEEGGDGPEEIDEVIDEDSDGEPIEVEYPVSTKSLKAHGIKNTNHVSILPF